MNLKQQLDIFVWPKRSPFFILEQALVKLHLRGRLTMSPGLRHQKIWAKHLSPEIAFASRAEAWFLLQEFTLPLIREHASSAHQSGISLLGLCHPTPPWPADLEKNLFYHSGWTLKQFDEELAPQDFFRLLADKAFPCVFQVRPTNEVFAASQPDLWHEAVGHLAPLVDPEVSEFYQWCGQKVTELYQKGANAAVKLEKVLWALLEYGFIVENENIRTFGAALTSSYMALQRWQRRYIYAELDWEPEDILRLRFSEEDSRIARNSRGQILCFLMLSLEDTKNKIERWLKQEGENHDH